MVCDAVEGTGAELPSRPYIEEAGSETDEESGRGFQCRVIIFNILSLAPASAHNDRATMRETMVEGVAALMARVLLRDYDAVKSMRNKGRSQRNKW